jgi:glycosyltransferase involved in cell wall biosynthesis
MRFFVVTPVRNSAGKIGRTIQSILGQSSLASGRDELRYLILDGASTDTTVDEAQKAGGGRVEIRSERDRGLYDALSHGLPLSDGDVTLWLNAGDVLEPTAFQIAGSIFAENPEVQWLTGRATARNNLGEIVESVLPHPFHRRLMDCGMYGVKLRVLQQEGTFWRTELQAQVDFAAFATTRLAGDYLLWRTFAARAELYVVNTILGSFTREPGQLSGDAMGAYRDEIRELARRPSLYERLLTAGLRQLTRHRIPGRSAQRLFTYDHRRERWALGRG